MFQCNMHSLRVAINPNKCYSRSYVHIIMMAKVVDPEYHYFNFVDEWKKGQK